MLQVTASLAEPVTVALNDWTAPMYTVTVEGLTEILTPASLPPASVPLSAPPPSCHGECKKDSDARGDDSRDDSTCDDEDHAGGSGDDGHQDRR